MKGKSNVRSQRNRAVAKFTQKLENKIRRIHNAVVEEVLTQTRVDTGLLRANWIPSLNQKTDQWYTYGIQIENLGPWPRGEILNFDFAWLQAVSLQGFKLGDTIWNTNVTPYQDNFPFAQEIASAKVLMIMAGQQEANK